MFYDNEVVTEKHRTTFGPWDIDKSVHKEKLPVIEHHHSPPKV